MQSQSATVTQLQITTYIASCTCHRKLWVPRW